MDELPGLSERPAGRYRRVDLQVPTEPDLLFLVRTVVEGTALASDFPLGFVTDAKLAVDQAATSLLEGAAGCTSLRCRLRAYADHLQISLAVDGETAPEALRAGLGWRMLTELAESASVSVQPGDQPGQPSTVVEFALRRHW